MGIAVFLCGSAGAGKDTLADLLEHAIPGTRRTAYADALYREAAQAFGVPESMLRERTTKETPLPPLTARRVQDRNPMYGDILQALGYDLEEPLSPRRVLETYGTEYRRGPGGHDAYWTDMAHPRLNHWLDQQSAPLVIVTDLRFADTELLAFRQSANPRHAVLAFEVLAHTPSEVLPPDGHVSRARIPEHLITAQIVNVPGYRQAMAERALDILAAHSTHIRTLIHGAGAPAQEQ